MTSTNPDPLALALQRHFGHESFLEGQESVLQRIMAGEDLCVIMPTGAGKSLCYQLPAMLKPGYTLVISPLISLMKDQVDALQQKNIPAAFINSTLTPAERSQTLAATAQGRVRLLYVAPERLRTQSFRDLIKSQPPALLVVDEAHCISAWGHDFRPDYARIGEFVDSMAIDQVCAFTATATPVVKQDIVKQLHRPRMATFVTGFTRPNLAFSVVHANRHEDKLKFIADKLQTPRPTIIYAATRKNVDAVADELHCLRYHAGMSPAERQDAQNRFMNDEAPVVVATNAFGMGIDRPDVRRVIHFNIPGSLEAYYQEAGRAGRDGEDAECVLLYGAQDRFTHEFLIEMSNPPEFVVHATYQTLLQLAEQYGTDRVEVSQQELAHLVTGCKGDQQISAALKILEKHGYLQRGYRSQNQGLLRLARTIPELQRTYPKADSQRAVFIHRIVNYWRERLLEGVPCTVDDLEVVSGLKTEPLRRVLRALNGSDLDWTPPFTGRGVSLSKPDERQAVIDFSEARLHADLETKRLDEMFMYPNARGCRQKFLIDYFGQDLENWVCQCCDRCTQHAHSERRLPDTAEAAVVSQILSGAAELNGRFGKNRLAQFLCGSRSLEVTRARLDRHPSYGRLSSWQQPALIKLINSLIDAGCLEVKGDRRYPLIQISALGQAVAAGDQQVPLSFHTFDNAVTADMAPPPGRRRRAAPDILAADFLDDSTDAGVDDLYARLCELRNSIAEKRRLIPYQVFNNKTLKQLADALPVTVEEARSVHGIGAKKEKTLLPKFLDEIRRWRQENGLSV